MEPKTPSPHLGPEQAGGYVPSLPESPIYATPERAPEQVGEQRAERPATQEQSQSTLPPPMVPVPVLPQPPAPQDDAAAVNPVSDTPLVAGDDDLIEKEWVDKAKKIIAETKDDPYKREQEVGKLQADYLKKRYGHELGEAA